MDKKIFGMAVLLAGVLIFAGAGCAQKVVGGLTGQITTEDKCIELVAYSFAGIQYGQGGNMAALQVLQQKVDNLKKQYGWSDEDITNSCKTFSDQKDFMERAAMRMQEIMSENK